ncbi:Gfo/Idh/MocA family protein [Jiangella alba]|uniref:Predicted dehydrogenase n=1 Tax=Jiangella alba TaxID=561176 RepID=A0A1H5M8R4_9ACTN|nr:Gfo/Idh/MocA family oxidoreductase [Jiangella alba]SEE85111.1 Predicted dehydrogenase [Jiangella alba]
MRIGMVGTESSHVDHFLRLLNVERRHGDARVVALSGGDSERNRALAATGGVATIVDGPDDLVGRVDAVLICSRDGRAHRAEAMPLIEAGLPVFVDKPLAASQADALAIVDAARARAVPLYEGSALRFVPALAGLWGGRPLAVHVSGPADPAGPYGGLYYYGVHLAEAAAELIGEPGDAGDVDVRTGDGVVTALTTIGGTHVTLTFLADTAAPFHATVVRADAATARELALPADYLAPVLDRFMTVAEKGAPPSDDEAAAMVAPVALLDAVTARL